MAQIDYFLKIAGVEGESTDDRHRGEIDVDSFSWGETLPPGSGSGSGGGTGRVQAQPFQIVKKVDKSSPILMIGCATGQHFPSAVLSAGKAGAAQQDYLKITIEDVTISSYQISGSERSDDTPMDQVSFNFARLEISYRPQNPDGSLGAEVKRKYDFVRHQQL